MQVERKEGNDTEELIIRQNNLPSLPVEDVKQYVDVIGDAIDGLKAKRNAASHLDCDQNVIDEMDRQIREYSAMKLQAQMELGKRTMKLEKNTGFHGNQFGEFHSVENTKNKSDQLAALGIASQRANDYEKMHKNEDVVNQYIEDSLEKGKSPSLGGALKEIKRQESYIKEGCDMKERKKSKPPLNPGGFTKEERRQRERIAEIVEGMYDTNAEISYTLDDFVEEISLNGQAYI